MTCCTLLLPQKAVDEIEGRLGVERQKASRGTPRGPGVGLETLHHFLMDRLGVDRGRRAVIFECRCTSPASSACCTSSGIGEGSCPCPLMTLAFEGYVVEAEDHVLRIGTMTARRSPGLRTLFALYIIRDARLECASSDSGTCTAHHGRRRSRAFERRADQRGEAWTPVPSMRIGSNAWMPRRWERRRALEHDGVFADHLVENVPGTSGRSFSDEVFLACLTVERQAFRLAQAANR